MTGNNKTTQSLSQTIKVDVKTVDPIDLLNDYNIQSTVVFLPSIKNNKLKLQNVDTLTTNFQNNWLHWFQDDNSNQLHKFHLFLQTERNQILDQPIIKEAQKNILKHKLQKLNHLLRLTYTNSSTQAVKILKTFFKSSNGAASNLAVCDILDKYKTISNKQSALENNQSKSKNYYNVEINFAPFRASDDIYDIESTNFGQKKLFDRKWNKLIANYYTNLSGYNEGYILSLRYFLDHLFRNINHTVELERQVIRLLFEFIDKYEYTNFGDFLSNLNDIYYYTTAANFSAKGFFVKILSAFDMSFNSVNTQIPTIKINQSQQLYMQSDVVTMQSW